MAREIIDFEGERNKHGEVLGRGDMLGELEGLLLGAGESGWVLVKGGPGLGKSAVLAEWSKRHQGRAGLKVVEHYLRRGEEQWERPEVVRRNLAAQVEQLYPGQVDTEARPESRLRELLRRVSRKRLVPRGERLVLVVDGLDEAEVGVDGSNPLPRFLPEVLPPGVWVLCSSRPTYPYLSWLEGLARVHTLDLDGEQWRGSNEAVVRECWRRAARGDEALSAQALVEGVVERSEGNALYTVKLAAMLEGREARRWREQLLARGPEVLPKGLEKILGEREKELNARLAEHLCRWPGDEGEEGWQRSYALRHGVTHWLSAGRWQKARELYANVDYLAAQCEEVGVLALEEDLERAAERVPQAQKKLAMELHRAIQAESHVLRREPQALARSLYNRLMCRGWSAKEIEKELHFRRALGAALDDPP